VNAIGSTNSQLSKATTNALAVMTGGGSVASSTSSGGGSNASTNKDTMMSSYQNLVTELPIPISILLEYNNQWSRLTTSLQQQILHQVHNTTAINATATGANVNHHNAFSFHHPSSTTQQQHEDNSNITSTKITKKQYMINQMTVNTLRLTTTNSNFVHYTSHLIQNQKLIDLLSFLDFLTGNNMQQLVISQKGFFDDIQSNPQHALQYQLARQELDRNEELHLSDRSFGPLILPGPKKVSSSSQDDNNHAVEGEDDENIRLFSYSQGWPELKKEYYDQLDKTVHPRMHELGHARHYALKQVSFISLY